MTYKEALDKLDHIYEPELRAEEISQDIHDVFSDGSVLGELIASSVGEALAQAIEKTGLDNFINQGIDEVKFIASEAVHNAINSDQFTHEFASSMAKKEVERELLHFPEEPKGNLEPDKD